MRVVIDKPRSNRGGEGGNFLYADGHSMFFRVPQYDELVRSIGADSP